ncbi:hypothetical protein EW146_g4312 [Bondarzewia mesenterica]|uniref:RNA-binding S4 domain-containing protein n=1 Tax=Bondarzewia mesenterica TaxID=1095465 RepID=A0A4S4LUY6_9AGAM|nr:hypothetical protein EW146_g4312 [Bondarzewia mesenterica]
MRDVNVYSFARALPRMSWHRYNLYNLWRRSLGELAKETDFKRTQKTLFQQRWAAKALVRAYHGDFINEKAFKQWYLPSTLPDVRPRRSAAGDDTLDISKWAKQDKTVEKERRKREEEAQHAELAPVGSLMFAEVERRIDVFIFRACLAHSVYDARRMVVHGDVLLNGKKHQNSNTRLAPGDMVSVNPKAIQFLQPKREKRGDIAGDNAPAVEQVEGESSSASEEDDSLAAPPKRTYKPKEKKSDLTPFNLPAYASPFIFIPAYIEPSFATCSAIYVRHPTARPGYSEIPTPYDADGEVVRLAWEWYSKVRPRMRSRSQLARMPENRQ